MSSTLEAKKKKKKSTLEACIHDNTRGGEWGKKVNGSIFSSRSYREACARSLIIFPGFNLYSFFSAIFWNFSDPYFQPPIFN